MSFEPNPTLLQQAVALLVASQAPGANQAAVQASLDEANKNPEFTLYLVYILVQGPALGLPLEMRQLAGLVARGNVQHVYNSCTPAIVSGMRAMSLQGLVDPEGVVRKTANNIVATLARQSHALETWRELFPHLNAMLQSGNDLLIEAALATLANVCEDVGTLLDSDLLGRPLNDLFPLMLRFASSPNPVFVRYALSSAKFVLGTDEDDVPVIVVSQISTYLDILSKLTRHPDAEVRRLVCESLICLLDRCMTSMVSIVPSLTDYFLDLCQNERDASVKLQAFEYWSALTEAGVGEGKDTRVRKLLQEKFPVLFPLLVRNFRYSEEELADLPEKDVADEMVADSPEDVRPFMFKAKDEEDEPDKGPAEQWTLRRCCAIDLDVIACAFGEDMLPSLLPILKSCFQTAGDTDDAWHARECGILALGVIAEGAGEFMFEYFGMIAPFLVSELRDPRPLVRSTTCWTISRYASFFASDEDLLGPVLDGVLAACLDHTKKVQETAIVALGALVSEGGDSLAPYIGKILSAVSGAFAKYQARNMLSLFDTVACLAEVMGAELQRPEYSHAILSPLVARWNTASDDDEMLFLPLVECLVFVAAALGPTFAPFAPEVYKRCMNILEKHLTLVVAAKEMDDDPPPKNFIVVAVDMLDALCGALEGSFEAFLAADRAKLMQMALYCIQDPSSDVRQSSFALLGDLVLHAFPHVAPHVNAVLTAVLDSINPARPKVTSNAVWVLGEIALKMGPAIAPYAPPLIAKIGQIVNDGERNTYIRSLLVNCAACLGRMTSQCPEVAAPLVESFFFNWCRCVVLVESSAEGRDCVAGLAAVVCVSPMLGLRHLVAWSYVIASKIPAADSPETPAVISLVQRSISAMKATAGPEKWPQALGGVEEEVMKAIMTTYGPVF